MSSSARPPRRRPAAGRAHPPAVYRRRRIVVVAALCLLVFAVFKLLPGGDEQDARPASAGTSSTPTATPSPTASPTPKRSAGIPEDADKNRVVRVDLPAQQGRCDPSTVRVTPAVKPGAYAGGAVPIQLTFTTSGSKPCSLDVGAKNLLLEVDDDDGDAVWTSSTCDEVPQKTLTLRPSWGTMLDATWTGRESRKGCGQPGEYVAPGSYHVSSAVLAGEPGEATFKLGTRPEPEKDNKNGKKNSKKDGDKGSKTQSQDKASGSGENPPG